MKKTYMGVRLRRLRAQRGLSQIALAQTLGISASYLNQIEQNQRPLTVQVLLKIHRTLGVDIQQSGMIAPTWWPLGQCRLSGCVIFSLPNKIILML